MNKAKLDKEAQVGLQKEIEERYVYRRKRLLKDLIVSEENLKNWTLENAKKEILERKEY